MSKAYLYGGIGNQLFQLSAGKFFSRGNPANETYCHLITKNEAVHNSEHDLDYLLSRELPRLNNRILRRLFRRIARQNRTFRYLVCKTAGIYFAPTDRPVEEHWFDKTSINAIDGYFQSQKYALFAKPILDEALSQIENRDRFKSTIRDFNIDFHWDIAVHVRRGDYLLPSGLHANLEFDYFERATNQFDVLNENRKKIRILVFSDDPNLEKLTYFSSAIADKVEIFENRYDLMDIEVIALMSKFHRIVISNSTFSWWAAFLGKSPKEVVAPSRWFKLENSGNQPLEVDDWIYV